MKSELRKWTPEILTVVLVASLVVLTTHVYGASVGPNNRNVTVDTTVNITNSFPEILTVEIFPQNRSLNAAGTATVTVNTTIRDFDGYTDIDTVNLTFFDANVVNASSPDDNNTHYSNSSCTRENGDNFTANYTCKVDLLYYANNGSNWVANVTVNDSFNFNDTETNTSIVARLLALNVTTRLIDYGNLAVGEINDNNPREVNISNFGNTRINVSVYGYGVNIDDGLAMDCEQRNISVDNERYDVNSSLPWDSMNNLTSDPEHIPGFNVKQRENESFDDTINQTYWKLRVPTSTNPAGRCNGSVVFQAELTG